MKIDKQKSSRRWKWLTLGTVAVLTIGDAATLLAQGDAGQAGEFLRFGVGAKALGLGRAFTSVADDASALYWNPAGLGGLNPIGGTVMFMHLPLREGASLNYLGGALPLRLFFVNKTHPNLFERWLENLNIGLGRTWFSLGSFEAYDENGLKQQTSGSNRGEQAAWFISVAYPIDRIVGVFFSDPQASWLNFFRGTLNMGFTTKLVEQDLFGFSGSATEFDLGFQYVHHSELFKIGLILRNISASRIHYERDVLGDKIPASATIGVSLSPSLSWLQGTLLSLDYDLVTPGQRERELMFGFEYDLSLISSNLPIKLRFGTNSRHEAFTIGINVSPETTSGHDWLPSGDWTFADEKTGLDAVGARFSFSLDRNPFTAKYWYQRGMAELHDGRDWDRLSLNEIESATKYFKQALKAKNPGKRAYRFEAALRLADLEFLKAIRHAKDLVNTESVHRDSAPQVWKGFRRVVQSFEKKAAWSAKKDHGKESIDRDQYFISFIYYVQALILADNVEKAIQMCTHRGLMWGKRVDVNKNAGGDVVPTRTRIVDYLHAYALLKNHSVPSAFELLAKQQDREALAKYLLAHFHFLSGDYATALSFLSQINLNHTRFPEHIFVPLTFDGYFGDEVLFLKAASIFKQSRGRASNDHIYELAKILRFYPGSDVSRFLRSESENFFRLIEHLEEHNEAMAEIFEKFIVSYIKAFQMNTLNTVTYSLNF